jgi:hypothetical protein
MPYIHPGHIKQAVLSLAKRDGLTKGPIMVEIEVLFDADGNPRPEPIGPGYQITERTIQRWLNEAGVTKVDVSNFPAGAFPHPDADISKIRDAMTRIAINAAEDSVEVRDDPRLPIREVVGLVLADVAVTARPRSQEIMTYLAERYLPPYIRAFRKSPWKNRVLLLPEDEAMIGEALNKADEKQAFKEESEE